MSTEIFFYDAICSNLETVSASYPEKSLKELFHIVVGDLLVETVVERGSFLGSTMDGEYEQFAKDTYKTAYNNMHKAVMEAGDLPVFVMSAERHGELEMDNDLYDIILDNLENPANAAIYTHIANIQAASDLAGKNNIVVSIEVSDTALQKMIVNVGSGKGIVGSDPMNKVVEFAVNNGYEVVASDPLHGFKNGERYDAEIEALGKHALRTENTPKILVHIGGAAHIGTLQGYKASEIVSDGDTLIKDSRRDPFSGIYGQTLFYNTAQSTPVTHCLSKSVAKFNYYTNPENAIQIDPPGAMTENDYNNVFERIQEASAEYHKKPEIAPYVDSKPEVSNGFKM